MIEIDFEEKELKMSKINMVELYIHDLSLDKLFTILLVNFASYTFGCTGQTSLTE